MSSANKKELRVYGVSEEIRITVSHFSKLVSNLVKKDQISFQSGKHLLNSYQKKPTQDVIGFLIDRNLTNPNPPYNPLDIDCAVSCLGEVLHIPYYSINPLRIDGETCTTVINKAFASRLNIFPVEVSETEVHFVTSSLADLSWISQLERNLKRKVTYSLGNPQKIKRLIEEFFTVKSAFNKVDSNSKEANLLRRRGKVGELDSLIQQKKIKHGTEEGNNVGAIVDWLIRYAFEERASDIHLEYRKGLSRVRFRIDGDLRTVYTLGPEVLKQIISRIKILSELKVDEVRRPQDGRLKAKISEESLLELRVSVIPTATGEKMVMRLFSPDQHKLGLKELGFSTKLIEEWSRSISKPFGLILVTGPTGSGKTTTLYSSMKSISRESNHVCTIEDPIEIVNEEYTQVQVNNSLGVDFVAAIRSFLRQDPDVIMVGEIRDKETAEMAIQASLTGHLVFSTLHTNNALGALARLLDLGVPEYQIRESLTAVLAQRLVKCLCDHCKEPSTVPSEIWKKVFSDYSLPCPDEVFGPKGCERCHFSGYQGRTVLYEFLEVDFELRDKISAKPNLGELNKFTLERGFKPMVLSAYDKLIEGVTSLDEVLKILGI